MNGIQLYKRLRSLEMTEICSWWTALGASVMAHDIKLRAWTMRSEEDKVVWVR